MHSELESHIFTDSWDESESEIEMALLKYFAPSKTFNVHARIHKHMAHLWVWLHLHGQSSKIKMRKRLK